MIIHITTRKANLCISPPVLSHADEPPYSSSENEQTPRCNSSDNAREIPGLVSPKLRRSDAAGTVADKEHGIGDAAFRVAFDVGGAETE